MRGWKAETNCFITAGVSRAGSTVMTIGTMLRARVGSVFSSSLSAAPMFCASSGQTSGQKV